MANKNQNYISPSVRAPGESRAVTPHYVRCCKAREGVKPHPYETGWHMLPVSFEDALKHEREHGNGTIAVMPSSIGCAVIDIDRGADLGKGELMATLGDPAYAYPTSRGSHLWYRVTGAVRNGVITNEHWQADVLSVGKCARLHGGVEAFQEAIGRIDSSEPVDKTLIEIMLPNQQENGTTNLGWSNGTRNITCYLSLVKAYGRNDEQAAIDVKSHAAASGLSAQEIAQIDASARKSRIAESANATKKEAAYHRSSDGEKTAIEEDTALAKRAEVYVKRFPWRAKGVGVRVHPLLEHHPDFGGYKEESTKGKGVSADMRKRAQNAANVETQTEAERASRLGEKAWMQGSDEDTDVAYYLPSIIPCAQPIVFFGEGGVGKSTIVRKLCEMARKADTAPFEDGFEDTLMHCGRVLWWTGDTEDPKRVQQIFDRVHGLELNKDYLVLPGDEYPLGREQDSYLDTVYLHKSGARSFEYSPMTRILDLIDEAAFHNDPFSIIVFDCLSNIIGDALSVKAYGVHVEQAICRPVIERGVTPIFIHHTKKEVEKNKARQAMRGTRRIEDHMRAVYMIESEDRDLLFAHHDRDKEKRVRERMHPKGKELERAQLGVIVPTKANLVERGALRAWSYTQFKRDKKLDKDTLPQIEFCSKPWLLRDMTYQSRSPPHEYILEMYRVRPKAQLSNQEKKAGEELKARGLKTRRTCAIIRNAFSDLKATHLTTQQILEQANTYRKEGRVVPSDSTLGRHIEFICQEQPKRLEKNAVLWQLKPEADLEAKYQSEDPPTV